MPRKGLGLIALLSLALIVTACASLPAATAPATVPATAEAAGTAPISATEVPATATAVVDLNTLGSKTLIILHTNDVVGYTDPCG